MTRYILYEYFPYLQGKDLNGILPSPLSVDDFLVTLGSLIFAPCGAFLPGSILGVGALFATTEPN